MPKAPAAKRVPSVSTLKRWIRLCASRVEAEAEELAMSASGKQQQAYATQLMNGSRYLLKHSSSIASHILAKE